MRDDEETQQCQSFYFGVLRVHGFMLTVNSEHIRMGEDRLEIVIIRFGMLQNIQTAVMRFGLSLELFP